MQTLFRNQRTMAYAIIITRRCYTVLYSVMRLTVDGTIVFRLGHKRCIQEASGLAAPEMTQTRTECFSLKRLCQSGWLEYS